MRIKGVLRWCTLHSSRTQLGRFLNRLAYRFALWVSIKCLSRKKWVHSIYVRGSMATGSFWPGLSDIDLSVVVNDQAKEEQILEEMHALTRKLRFLFPMLGDLWLFTVSEFERAVTGPAVFFGAYPKGFRLLHGPGIESPRDLCIDQTVAVQAKLLLRTLFRSAGMAFFHASAFPWKRFLRVRESPWTNIDELKEAPPELEHLLLEYNEARVNLESRSNYCKNRDSETLQHLARVIRLATLTVPLIAEQTNNPHKLPLKPARNRLEPLVHARVKQLAKPFLKALSDQQHLKRLECLVYPGPFMERDYRILLIGESWTNLTLGKLREVWQAHCQQLTPFLRTYPSPLVSTPVLLPYLSLAPRSAFDQYAIEAFGFSSQGVDSVSFVPTQELTPETSLLPEGIVLPSYARRKLFEYPSEAKRASAGLVDVVCGLIPGLDLVLRHQVLALTLEEISVELGERDTEYSQFVREVRDSQLPTQDPDDSNKLLREALLGNVDLVLDRAQYISCRCVDLLPLRHP